MLQTSGTTDRLQPRLWVETLWILESLEANQPIREISLTRGLNLVLSPPVKGSTGHGVGKTAFCQLLRFALEDPQWASGSPLRDELLHAIPDGAVAACVHVGRETWTVVKPWLHQRQYRAARGVTWQQLARNEVSNEHDEYVAALQDSLIEILPVKRLPGSNQQILWHHVLAWCSRDQGSRYQSYYHWRTEGVGFTLPAQSPALVIRVVLGLLRDASTLDQLRKQEDRLRDAEGNLANVKRRPEDLLAHVKHQLANTLGAHESSPFRTDSLFDDISLLALAMQRRGGYEHAIEEAQEEQSRLELSRANLLEFRVPLTKQSALLRNYIAQLKATIDGNMKEVERLRSEPEALQKLFPQFCEPGNRRFENCEYVLQRANTIQFETVQDVAQRDRSQQGLQGQLVEQRSRLEKVERELEPIGQQLDALVEPLAEAKERELSARSDLKRLQEAIADYEFYENVVSGASQWQELAKYESAVDELQREVGQLKVKLEAGRDAYAQRSKAIDLMIDSVAKRLPGFAWGVFNDREPHPFHMGPVHSTTFGVLETLVGDLVCLLDSSSAESFHPGFLVHDSPREAEMSEAVFWALLSVVRLKPNSPFQYIVTTTTEASSAFDPFVRLTLHTKDDEGMLFRRRVGVESKPLQI